MIHLRDWHIVPRDAFDKDVQSATRHRLSKEDLDQLYAEHLDAVEVVQKQLDAVLRELAARHKSLVVYVEGLTDDGVEVFRLKATALSDVGAEQIPQARKSLADVIAMKGKKAQALAKQYEALIARHRAESLELGAALGLSEGVAAVSFLPPRTNRQGTVSLPATASSAVSSGPSMPGVSPSGCLARPAPLSDARRLAEAMPYLPPDASR